MGYLGFFMPLHCCVKASAPKVKTQVSMWGDSFSHSLDWANYLLT